LKAEEGWRDLARGTLEKPSDSSFALGEGGEGGELRASRRWNAGGRKGSVSVKRGDEGETSRGTRIIESTPSSDDRGGAEEQKGKKVSSAREHLGLQGKEYSGGKKAQGRLLPGNG